MCLVFKINVKSKNFHVDEKQVIFVSGINFPTLNQIRCNIIFLKEI